MKKLLSVLLTIVHVVALAVPLAQPVSAATTCESGWVGSYSNSLTDLAKIKALMNTSAYKMSRFEQILKEYPLMGYFTTGSTVKDPEKNNTTVHLNGSQCFGYAQYCGYKFFGTVQQSGQREVLEKDISSVANFKNYLNKYSDLTGAHFRDAEPGSPHSLVYLARDDNYIYFIDANSGSNSCGHYNNGNYNCKIHLRRFTYSDFLEKYTDEFYIYYQESPTSSSIYTQSVLNDNVITETNAILYGRIEKPYLHTVNKIGIRVRKEGTSYTDAWTKIENPSKPYTGKTLVQPYYNLNTELGIILTPGTRYYYQFYGKVNDVEYWSTESSFIAANTSSSKPSVTIAHGYTGCTDTITDDNAIVYGTLNKPSGTSVEKFGIRIKKTGGSYSNAWTYMHDPKSTYSTSVAVKFWYDIKEEMGITLTHLTSYTYQLYSKVDGVEYWSSEKTFTTTGSHSYGSWQVVTKATCTETGTEKRSCACGATETKTIPALGHDHNEDITKPTCTEQGYTTFTCDCGDSYVGEYVDPLGHDWVDDKCSRCGMIMNGVFAKGDINGDGNINSTDFMQVRRHFLGLYTIPAEKQAADVNGDGKINSTDFMQVRRHFLGLFDIYA